jgi:LacI family transcriptional regulator
MIGEICSFFDSQKKVDAVFFATNYLGITGLEAIKRLGLHIPSQLAVVSFDDHDLYRLHTPSITAVVQPIQKMSEKLITILLDKIEKGLNEENQQVVVSPELIVRDSSSIKT